jgi:ArsR family transcriptional regulator
MIQDLIEELKALADETRLRILNLIWEGEDLCSCEIERILGLKQSNTSRHMRRLKEAGLVRSYKKAQWIHYRIPAGLREESSYISNVVSTARRRQEPFEEDILKLQDYRRRGFTCATIYEWVPFELGRPSSRFHNMYTNGDDTNNTTETGGVP